GSSPPTRGGDLWHGRRQRGDRGQRWRARVRSAHPGGHPCHPAGLLARPRVRRLPRPRAPPRRSDLRLLASIMVQELSMLVAPALSILLLLLGTLGLRS